MSQGIIALGLVDRIGNELNPLQYAGLGQVRKKKLGHLGYRRLPRVDAGSSHVSLDRLGHRLGHHARYVPRVFPQIADEFLVIESTEGNLNGVEPRPIYVFCHSLDHPGPHAQGPEALRAVAKRRVDEMHVHDGSLLRSGWLFLALPARQHGSGSAAGIDHAHAAFSHPRRPLILVRDPLLPVLRRRRSCTPAFADRSTREKPR